MKNQDYERLELETKAFITDLLSGVNTEDGIHDIISYIMKNVGSFTGSDRVCVYELSTGQNSVNTKYQWNNENDCVEEFLDIETYISTDETHTWLNALKKKQLVLVENRESISLNMPMEYRYIKELGISRFATIPVYARGQLIACMSLINYDYQAFSLTERIWLYLGQQMGSIYRRDRMNHKYLLFMDGIRSSNLTELIVDFRTKRYEAFRITEVLRNVIPEEGDWDWLRQFYASIIKPEYKDDLLKRTDQEYIETFLCKENSSYAIDLEREIDGNSNWFRLEFSVVSFDNEEHLERFVLQVKNITKMKQEEEKQHQMIKALCSIYNASLIINLSERTVMPIVMSDIALKFFPNELMPYDKALDGFCSNLISEEYAEVVREFMNLDTLNERMRNTDRLNCVYQGTQIGWGLINLIPSQWNKDGTLEKVVFALQDITEQKCREEWMQYNIEHDELTGTLNRAAFSRVIKLLSDSEIPLAFVLMDIDKFKVINDTYGHDVGDKVLSRLVVVINEKIRTVDKIFRIGGDEFVIIMTRIVEDQADYVRQVVDSINDTIMEGYEDIPVFSVSAGVSFSEAGYSDSLYLNADKALYQTKQSSRMGCTIYGEN